MTVVNAGLFARLAIGPMRSSFSADSASSEMVASAIEDAAGSLASAWISNCGDSPRTRSRAKLTGTVIAKATSPSSSMRSASCGVRAVATISKYSEFFSAAPIDRAYALSSAICTTVGRCRGSVLMAKPNSRSCITGTPIISANVIRSRRIWMNSFIRIANSRRSDSPFISRRGLHALKMDKDVLEARRRLAYVVAFRAQRIQCFLERLALVAADMEDRTEERDVLDTRPAPEPRQQMAHIASFDHESDQPRLLDHVGHRAL